MPKRSAPVALSLFEDTRELQLGHFRFTPTACIVGGRPRLEESQRAAGFCARVLRASRWWVGDLLLYMDVAHGEAASQVLDATEWDEKTLANCRWVASRVAAETRRAGLEWSHHEAVAGLDGPAQRIWLDKAETGDGARPWTVHELRYALRVARRIQTYEQQDLPDGKYRVLLADPAWPYDDAGVIDGGHPLAFNRAENHYPTMPLEAIQALDVRSLASHDAVLFLWVTAPMLDVGIDTLRAWGFTYKAGFVWDKVLGNIGHYNRVRHEHLLIAVHGSCPPDTEEYLHADSVIQIERSAHSAKPDEVYDLIERLYPHGRRLELFARRPRAGWDGWGNQLPLGDPDAATATTPIEEAQA